MFPQTTFRPDPHLCFSQPINAPHPRNCHTIARLLKAFESYPLAKICAKNRRLPHVKA